MTQVLRVNRFTGEYVFLDKDGREIDATHSTGLIYPADADVLIERIRQGYQYIATGFYVIRLDAIPPLHQYDAGHYEFTELITFELDDDGYPVPTHTQLVTTEAFEHPDTRHSNVYTCNAFIDYKNMIVAWMNNPLATDPYVYDPNKAILGCEADGDAVILLDVGGRYLMRDKSDGFDLIPTRFYMG